MTVGSPTTDAVGWEDYTVDELLRAAYSMTHIMHGADRKRRDELRVQRDMITAEIKRRCEEASPE